MTRVRFPNCLALALFLAGPLTAQDPEVGVGAALGRCALRWRPLEADTRSVTNRDVADAHVTYVSGRYLWTCGGASMEADSAIKRDGPGQIELFGDVVYGDSIRTLKSEHLLYFQFSDFIIAENNVELTRLTDGSTLHGPRVEFSRAISGADAVTTAHGRPTVTFHPQDLESSEPFTINSEMAIFAGEDEARFYGDVVIDRSDLKAQADSAMLTRADGRGTLWGEPWIEAEGIRLEGDSITFLSPNEQLEEIHAIGDGYASGERFEVEARLIDIGLEDRQVEQVRAHGGGVSRARSGNHELHGDSIHFVMYESRIDTAYAMGDAVAVQRDSSWIVPPREEPEDAAGDSTGTARDTLEAPAAGDAAVAGADTTTTDGEGDEPDEVELPTDGSANWARGDTLVAVFERSGIPVPVPDSVAASDPFMSQMVIAGNASAFYRLVRDSTASSRPSLNYLVARRIQVDFSGGAPAEVEGEHAIGAFLEPRETFGTELPADSAAVADSTAVPPDPLAGLRDTSDVRSDSTTAPPDTVGTPPDTAGSHGPSGHPDLPLSLRSRPPGPGRPASSVPAPALRPRRFR